MMGFQRDKTLGDESGGVNNYPWGSPGYFVSTMRYGSHMDPLIRRLRDYLDTFIFDFQAEFSSSFSIQDFEQKFLSDKDLKDISIFFHYNFFYIYDLHVNAGGKNLDDDFSKLRGLDVFLNLALIIDEVLKVVYKKNKNGILQLKHYISTGIVFLNSKHNWMSDKDLNDYWYQKLKINDSEPDAVVPVLLNKSDTFNGNPIPKEIFTLSVAYNFRNFGAHNVKRQNTVVVDYQEIIKNLLYSLFLSIQNL
jgi:hypothetical protein